MIDEFFDGFAEGKVAEVGEEFAPESNIQKVGDGVIGADVDVDRFPVFDSFGVPGCLFVMWGSVAPEIPGRAGVAVESVGLAGHFLQVGFAGLFVFHGNLDFQPIFGLREGGAAGAVGFVVLDFG